MRAVPPAVTGLGQFYETAAIHGVGIEEDEPSDFDSGSC